MEATVRSPKRWRSLLDTLAWQVRGVVATETNRRIGFRMRELWQPGEVAARKQLARELSAEVDPRLNIPAEDGYLQLPSGVGPSVESVCEMGRARQRDAQRASTDERAFRRNHLVEPEHYATLLSFGLDRRVLAMISHYLGAVPVLVNIDFLFAFTNPPPFKKSQLWHCDRAAEREIKLFVYCDAVDGLDGPLTIIPADDSARARHELGYRHGGKRYRIADGEMDGVVPRDRQIPLLGPAGTVNAVDTIRCFHYGSRIVEPGHHRIVAVFVYVPPSCTLLPRRLASASGPLAHLATSYTDPLARAVLGVPLAA
jgi:hypothetical protein